MLITLRIVAALILVGSTAYAAGIGNVKNPAVVQGMGSIEYQLERYGDNSRPALNNKQSHKVEMEYGFTDRLEVGIEYNLRRNDQDEVTSNAIGLEGRYVLTKQGDYWLTSALQGEYAHAIHRADVDDLTAGFLISRKQGKTVMMGNLFSGYEVGGGRAGGVEISSALQVTQEIEPRFAPGIEWQATYGKLNDFEAGSRQEHYAGPVARGKFSGVGPGKIAYFAGYYRGLTDGSADNAALLKLEYEQRF